MITEDSLWHFVVLDKTGEKVITFVPEENGSNEGIVKNAPRHFFGNQKPSGYVQKGYFRLSQVGRNALIVRMFTTSKTVK